MLEGIIGAYRQDLSLCAKTGVRCGFQMRQTRPARRTVTGDQEVACISFPGSVSRPLPQAKGTGYPVKTVNGPDSLDLGHNPEDSKEVDHDHRDHPDV